MSNEIIRISNIARKYRQIDTVMYAINEENLKRSAIKMAGNKAVGIDKVTKKEYIEKLNSNIKDLIKRMKRMSYKPKAVRRTYIPKPGSDKKRPLGIPAFEDKIVQDLMSQILEAIYEPMFKEFSYGFRPGRSCHQAIAYLDKMLHREKVNYVVDLDIKGFFDNIDHEWLIKFIEYRIRDKVYIRYIKRFLKSGILEQGKLISAEKGTPQGGIISPILGNIYLHFVLDDWFEKVVERQTKGYAGMVRYADDSVACFQYKEEAEKYLRSVKKRLAKFGLEVSEEKTKILEFGRFAARERKKQGKRKPETFEFLGFTHYCSTGKNGQFRAKRKTSGKKFRAKVQEMKQWLRSRMQYKVTDTIKLLNIKLVGHYRYYGITDNTEAVRRYWRIVTIMLYKTLNRRTQKNKYSYKEYYNKIRNQIVRPRIYVDIVEMAYSM
mgnify:CR=1 FL=1